MGNYDNRDFYNIITNSDGNDTIDVNDANQFFDTQHFADGSYIFRVIASDASSNTTVDSMIIVINNFPTNTNSNPVPSILSVSPNPFSSNLTVAIPKVDEGQFKITVKNLIGQLVYTYKERNLLSSIKKVIDLDFLPNAIYFVEVEINGRRSIQKIIKE